MDKLCVDKSFGFGKVQTGEIVFIHASVVQGRSLHDPRPAPTQVVNAWMQERDKEKASRVPQQVRRGAARTAELAALSENKVCVVCDHMAGLRDEPTRQRHATGREQPFLSGRKEFSSRERQPSPSRQWLLTNELQKKAQGGPRRGGRRRTRILTLKAARHVCGSSWLNCDVRLDITPEVVRSSVDAPPALPPPALPPSLLGDTYQFRFQTLS